MKHLYFLLFTVMFNTKAFSQARFEWVETFTTNALVNSQVKLDPAGNRVVAGEFINFASYGTDTVWSYGTVDIVVAKVDASNNLLWIKPIGGTWYDSMYKLAVDETGNIYVSVGVQAATMMPDTTYTAALMYQVIKFDSDGNFVDHLDFPAVAQITTLGTDLYMGHGDAISKYNTDLQLVWTKSVTPAGAVTFSSAAFSKCDIYASEDGTLAAVGIEMGTGAMMIDTASFVTSATPYDEIVVVKMDTSGTAHWVRSVVSTNANSVSADNNGAVYVAPYVSPAITFNGVQYVNPIVAQGFLIMLKYNADGSEAWGLPVYANNGTPGPTDLACTPDNHILICGNYENAFNPYSLIGNVQLGGGYGELFVAKADDQGNVVWAKNSVNSSGSLFANSVVADGNNNFFLSGTATQTKLGCFTVSGATKMFFTLITEQPEPVPATQFTFTQNGNNVSFTNQTPTDTTFTWNFDDATPNSNQHSPFHTFTQPGVYNVCLTATNSCGDSTFCTNVTINGLDQIIPNHGTDNGVVTTLIIGGGFTASTTVKLTRIGFPDIIPVSATLTSANTISARFDLTGQALGMWTVETNTPVVGTFTLDSAFTIEPLIEDLEVSLSGSFAMKPNGLKHTDIAIFNRGNADVLGVPLFFRDHLDMQQYLVSTPMHHTSNDPFFQSTHQYLNDNGIDSSVMYLLYDETAVNYKSGMGVVIVPLLTPSELKRVHIYVKGTYDFTSRREAIAMSPMMTSQAWNGDYTPANDMCLGAFLKHGIEKAMLITIDDAEWNACFPAIYDSIRSKIVDIASTTNDLVAFPALLTYAVVKLKENNCITSLPATLTQQHIANSVRYTLTNLVYFNDIEGVRDACVDVNAFRMDEVAKKNEHLRTNEFCELVEGFYAGPFSSVGTATANCHAINGAVDPNSKYGPGTASYPYVLPGSVAGYNIMFENLDTATSAAQIVSILDTLDVNVIDASSFRFGAVTLADTVLMIPDEWNRNQFIVKDLRPAVPYYVKVEMSFDTTSGIARWSFYTLDTINMQPLDPTSVEGFLPPNVDSTQGTGSVSFNVSVKNDLITNASIDNTAHIYFDNNAPIATNTWHNEIDITKPESEVADLNDSTFTTTFTVNWSGADVGAGIKAFDVYVSENDAPYYIWLANTDTTNALFEGQLGDKYEFISIATDYANNREDEPIDPETNPDAVTTLYTGLENIDASTWQIDVFPNPTEGIFSVTVVSPRHADYRFDVFDVLGKQLKSIATNKNEIAIDLSQFANGVYTLRVTTENLTRTMRIVKR